MKLIVGLGNPGKEYENTRHNCGFRVLDEFSNLSHIEISREGFKGLYGKGVVGDEDVILLKPQTYMNLSGESVRELMTFFKIKVEDILVVYDDMAIRPGVIRIRPEGSSGGQKGIQNIIDNLKTDKIKRIRVGIGEPDHSGVDWVLGKPKGDEAIAISQAELRACKAIKEFIVKDIASATQKFNGGTPY
ncbi:MAG: aminoacyl-tRNA hydrolase [Bacilli bacterium]|nr:aminoacyl-tRNA hydrolase [Bacilli bacterium]